jgi:hypothetical protein
METALQDAVKAGFPGAMYVPPPVCVGDTGGLGVWFTKPDGDDDEAARDLALRSLDLLEPGENYAAFINDRFISSQKDAAVEEHFHGKPPLRIDDNGIVDPHAPTRINSVRIKYKEPNQVLVITEGLDERPVPDLDFRFSIIDTLSTSAGKLQATRTTEFDVDLDLLGVLAAIFGAAASTFGFGFRLASIVLLGEAYIASSQDPDPDLDVTDPVAILANEIMFPGGLKLVMHYERVQVTDGGIFTGGLFAVTPRTPSLSLIGARKIPVKVTSPPITVAYSVTTVDLRKPLAFAWTSDGNVASPNREKTTVTFHLPHHPDPEPGQELTHQVKVEVRDVDGLSQEAIATVQLYFTSGEPDDTKPPICRIKPWLPQCQDQP